MKKYRLFKNILIFASLGILITLMLLNGFQKNVSAKDKTYENLKVFTEIISLVQSDYVEEVNNEKLLNGAINGMLKTLDPHTAYMSPDVFREMQLETEGQFGGLGIEITIKDEQLTVVAPIDDTPADKAGIEAGDKIIKINGESTKNITLLQAVKKLRGSKGTKVTITIIREGLDEQKDFTITRDIIKIKSVSKRMLDDKIGYIKIRSFQKNTSKELDVALKELEKGIMHGLIMDLRNNPGGLLEQAVSVSDKFLEGEKLVVFTKGRVKDQNMRFHSKSKDAHVKYPMVVLVNAGSASASEIVAGALQDLERAVILGTPTFGKGSVQTVFPLSDGSGLRLTTSKYYTPKGRLIQGKGIIPDILVENRPLKSARLSESEKKRIIIREKDLKNHLKGEEEKSNDKSLKKEFDEKSETTILASKEDLQLQRAIDVLKGWKVFKETL